jgi:hypothetical protein
MKIAISLAANAKWVDHRWVASYSDWNDRSKLIIHFGFMVEKSQSMDS